MFNKSNFGNRGQKGDNASIRYGWQKNNSFKKSSNNGGINHAPKLFGNNAGFGRGTNSRPKSKLAGQDVNIFIRKAEETSSVENFTSAHQFSDFAIHSVLKQNIIRRGYTQPTPIQDQAIPPILEGRDLIGLADTGTGKTAAFLVPILDKLFKHPDQKALIIAPTRELAFQIREEMIEFSANMRIYSALLIGGADLRRQIQDLQRNPRVVIATPGRLKDHIERRNLRLFEYSTFVLDEVDLMVDIGFIHDVKYFVSLLPKERQSLFFSATISPKVREILNNFVQNPVTISVKKTDTSGNVEQDIVKVIDKEKKIEQLHDLLISEGFDKVLVFGRTKHGVEKLNKQLSIRGFKVGAIHGNKNQNQRQKTLDRFKNNEIKVLLATDVASRGLDIDSVTHVINYDLPENYEDYIHRIGRTGRANKKGIALTFVD